MRSPWLFWRRKGTDTSLLHDRSALARAESLAHFGTWQRDPAADRTIWSEELHRIYGLEPGTFEGTFAGYLSRVHEDDRPLVEQTVRESLIANTSLPRLQSEPEQLPAPDRRSVSGGTETVLVVDDSEPVLSLTRRIMDRAGYHVLTAPNADWALSVAARPDALLAAVREALDQ